VSEPARIVRCPTCRKALRWSTRNPWRPFCSERCRVLDLGDWAAERRRIPGSPQPASDDEPPAHDA
jgi:hypothetical protein